MSLQIDDPEILAEIEAQSRDYGVTPEEVLRKALSERRARAKERYVSMLEFLEEEVWPGIPADQIGQRLSKEEEETLLGYPLGNY